MPIKSIAPAVSQIAMRDLGKYGGYSGLNKLSHLISVIDLLINHIGWDIVIEEVNKELEKQRQYEEKTGNKTIYSHFKNWNSVEECLNNLRPIANEISFAYDDIRDKQFKSVKDDKESYKKINYKKLSKKISPYQPEIYWIFNVLMRISAMQKLTIKTEAFRTPELSKFTQKPFHKESRDKSIKYEL